MTPLEQQISLITFSIEHWRRFALSITDRTSFISKIQNVWSDRFSKRRRL